MFPKGHVSVRGHPTWGTDDEALAAERDAFFYTDAAPRVGFFDQGGDLPQPDLKGVSAYGPWRPSCCTGQGRDNSRSVHLWVRCSATLIHPIEEEFLGILSGELAKQGERPVDRRVPRCSSWF